MQHELRLRLDDEKKKVEILRSKLPTGETKTKGKQQFFYTIFFIPIFVWYKIWCKKTINFGVKNTKNFRVKKYPLENVGTVNV